MKGRWQGMCLRCCCHPLLRPCPPPPHTWIGMKGVPRGCGDAAVLLLLMMMMQGRRQALHCLHCCLEDH